uniref:Disintegrin and metalloproteinase domain-containing protein 9-like n=1 Tax=Geotrypetes seraphini TaxID=260995 RepID=A0A6P8R6V8_GEOSA|nr:disintegrin and metalloproteinase domain-containing protein 9-like [Geotrypetes seraphini]
MKYLFHTLSSRMSKSQVPFTVLCLALTMLSSIGHALTLNTSFYEVTIPKKLEPKDGRGIENDCYYQGYVEGIKGSIVALSTCSGLRGFLQTKTLNYGIQPMESSYNFQHLVYRMKDVDFENSTCGVETEITRMDMFITEPPISNIKERRRYVELALVIDYEWYSHRQKNTTMIVKEMVQLVYLVDAMYDTLNIDFVLLGIEIWTNESLIDIVQEVGEEVLMDFRQWTSQHFRDRMHYDEACLILNRKYAATIGMAYVGTICSRYSSVLFISFIYPLETVSVILAHETGHTLNMQHDSTRCNCPFDVCIMLPKLSSAIHFSECSIKRYTELISSTRADCTLNVPLPEKIFSLCGNKLVDRAEECDCGNEKECKADPCCRPHCMLKKGAQCTSGLCCKHCKFIKKGKPCRAPVSECDLTEYCSGVSATCPPDFYFLDGTPCNDGQSVCYNKTCYDPNRHCRELFGKRKF